VCFAPPVASGRKLAKVNEAEKQKPLPKAVMDAFFSAKWAQYWAHSRSEAISLPSRFLLSGSATSG
jgi:hypothetical protein